MKFFVTGATGFIGSNLARVLLGRGHSVRALVRGESSRKNVEGLDIELIEGDLRDNDLDLSEAMAGCDGVHISIAGPAELPSAQNVASLAPSLGVKRITYITGATAVEENRWFPMTAAFLMH